MQTSLSFSKALERNIENTFTYAMAKNQYGYEGEAKEYSPHSFFRSIIKVNPFGGFMKLERYGYLNTKKALDRYDIPYTAEQDRKARVLFDVETSMQKHRADVVGMWMEDDEIEDTGVIRYADGLTTEKTLKVKEFLETLPANKKTSNIFYTNKLDKRVAKSKDQTNAVKNSLDYHISVLIGGAGTGKSTVTASIIDQLGHNKKTVAVLAPTHKAKESLQSKLSNAGGMVKTIHSFVYNPTACNVIVIDEAGMIGTDLLHMLSKVYRGQQLIFVGDKNQLEPVGNGRPFETIQEIFSTHELKENFRSESRDIINLSKEIIGQPFNANMEVENIVCTNSLEKARTQGAEVVLSFTNAVVDQVNESYRIKGGKRSMYPAFAVGDKIIAITNSPKWFNGQLFEITEHNQIAPENGGSTVDINDSRDLEYNFKLAYGLTIHKSQGSEWDTVAYVPSPKDTNKLAYVAITRAKKKLIIVGDIPESFKEQREWRRI